MVARQDDRFSLNPPLKMLTSRAVLVICLIIKGHPNSSILPVISNRWQLRAPGAEWVAQFLMDINKELLAWEARVAQERTGVSGLAYILVPLLLNFTVESIYRINGLNNNRFVRLADANSASATARGCLPSDEHDAERNESQEDENFS